MTGILLPDGHEVRAAEYNRLLAAGTNEGYVYYGATTGWRLPWNVPWGRVVSVAVGSDYSFTTPIADVSSATVAWTALANRAYRALAFAALSSSVADDQVDLVLTDASNASFVGSWMRADVPPVVATRIKGVSWVTGDFSVAGGSATVKLRAVRANGTGTCKINGATFATFVMVEDIGPNGTAPTS